MPFVATVAFIVYQKVHLLLDDITVVATEGDERCLGGLRMHKTLSTFQNHTTVISSTEIHTNNCIVLINESWNQTQAEDQKLKIILEWPKDVYLTAWDSSLYKIVFPVHSSTVKLLVILWSHHPFCNVMTLTGLSHPNTTHTLQNRSQV